MRDTTWRRYARLLGPDPAADIDDEMELHVQLLTDKYLRAGHAPREARAMAMQEFGDRARARDACLEIDRAQLRARRRGEWWRSAWTDVARGVRRLALAPVFAIMTVLTLAIGIGPNVAVFSIINAVLLQPLPFASPDRLVELFETFPLAGGEMATGSVSYANFRDWQAQTRAYDAMAIANFTGSANLERADGPERLAVAQLGANAFSLLGVRPILGRAFVAGEDSVGSPPVVVLSETLWRRRFAADRRIVGRRITLDGVPTTVIGVIPARVVFPNRTAVVDAWTPLQVQLPANARRGHNYLVLGRLRAGATVAQANAELKQVAGRLATQFPDAQEGRSAIVTPYRETLVGYIRPRLYVLLGAAGLVLLIACANAASLLLARAAARQREVAVLSALGAGRARIARQFLVESLLLAAGGALLGFVLAVVGVRAITAAAGNLLPKATAIHFDWRVVLFIVATIVLTTLLFGIAPALQASRGDLQACLRDGARGGSVGRARSTFRNTLVVAQFALSLVLLAGAGLLLRTFAALLGTPTGMQTTHVLTMRIPLAAPSPRYADGTAAVTRFYVPLLERVRALPGVTGAGVITMLPLEEWGMNGNFTVAGKAYATVAEQPFAEIRAVSPGYFATLGIAIQRGRDVAASDVSSGMQVLLVNDVLAKKYFPNEDPIGKAVYFGTPSPTNPPNVIVGIVSSVRQASLDRAPMAEVYAPYTQAGTWGVSSVALAVRTTGDPTLVTNAVRGAIRAIDPNQPVYNVRSMDDVVARSVGDRRLYLGLLGTFAGVALVLAIAGIYGVIAYSVAQRTREFGIRLALGSEVARVQRLVVWHGAQLALLGLAIGVPAAFLLTRLLAGLLYGVAPWDPTTFAAVAAILAAVSVVASWVPARRVARVDPILAMRAE